MKKPQRHIDWCPASKCPKCGVTSPCFDHKEVDIGIGVQYFDHEYECPEHGLFALVLSSEEGTQHVIFRHDP